MSFFGVTKHVIEEIYPHSNADKLELGKVSGLSFQFVMGVGNYKVGDEVMYFPIDSLIPTELAEKMGLVGFDPEKASHRIRTVTLRGEISQGFVCPPRPEYIDMEIFERGDSEEMTEHLGVTKYEPEENICQDGILRELPAGIGIYDIEGAERNMDVIDSLMDVDVQITEKLEGANFSVTSYVNGEFTVNSRNNTIEEMKQSPTPKTPKGMAKSLVNILYNMEIIERPSRENPEASLFGKSIIEKFESKIKSDLVPKPNVFWENARKLNVIELAKQLTVEYNFPVIVYGELIGPGVQSNYYGLKDTTVKIFDIKVARDDAGTVWDYIPVNELKEIVNEFYEEDNLVPELFVGKLRDWIGDSDVVSLSNGKSVINDKKLREGVVIKSLGEDRTIIKQRDPVYLSKTGF